jgi:ribosomal protein L11 methyltransferase
LRAAEADLLFANLLLRPLLELAPASRRRSSAGRHVHSFRHSTTRKARQVEARFRALGFRLDSRILLGGWTTLLLGVAAASKMPAD